MVSEEELQALDFLVWFGTGRAAAEQAGTNQSTISRRVRQVLSTFQLSLKRQHGTVRIRGRHRDLLTLQRRVHQGRRLLGRGAMRLAVDALAWPLMTPTALPAWHLGRSDHLDPAGRMDLLRDHVLEAWIGPIPTVGPFAGAGDEGIGMRIFPLLQSASLWPWLTPPADHEPPQPELLTIGLMVTETHAEHVSIAALCQVMQQQRFRLMGQHPGLTLQLPPATDLVSARNGSIASPLAATIS